MDDPLVLKTPEVLAMEIERREHKRGLKRASMQRWRMRKAGIKVPRAEWRGGNPDLNPPTKVRGLSQELLRAIRGGAEGMNDVQWNELKSKVLLGTVTDPTANAGASLKAIEAMDRQRERAKFGTREAVEATLKKCEERMRELDEMERMVIEQIGGTGGGAETSGETTTGAANGA